MKWVPLHVHSQYSDFDATASLESIAKTAARYEMAAVALTDHGNLYGAVEFFKECKAVKIQPIIGCEVYVAPGSRLEKKKESGQRTSYHLTLLAKDNEGYHNLAKLSSIGFLEGFYYKPRIDHETLKQYSKGLICLSGCLSSRLAQEILKGPREQALETLHWYQDLFGEDYYLELMRHAMSETDLQNSGFYQETWRYQQYLDYIAKQEKVNAALIEFAAELNIRLVATNDSHFIDQQDWRAHEILLNVQSGEPTELIEKDASGNIKFRRLNPKRATYSSIECYFKNPQQMATLFADIPEAITNTLEIAEKCHVELDFNTRHYPVYIPPSLADKSEDQYTTEEQAAAVESFLWELCEKGIPLRYTPERLQKSKRSILQKPPRSYSRTT